MLVGGALGETLVKLPFRYNRYLFFLDIYGFLSATLVIGYLVLPAERPWSSPTDSMIGNVLSELIGIYVSVRLIEFFMTRNERRERVRVRVVRNARFIETTIANIFMFRNGFEAFRLRRELIWVAENRTKRYRHLSPDEVRDAEAFYRKVADFCDLIPSFMSVFGRNVTFTDEARAAELLKEIEEARLALEENILEETDEDDGL